MGCDIQCPVQLHATHNFNPRTRVGCDVNRQLKFDHTNTISIHAPAWGATKRAIAPSSPFSISIHAPAWGATAISVPHCFYKDNFNPRTRVGCDGGIALRLVAAVRFQSTHPRGVRLSVAGKRAGLQGISIHAPAWGATSAPNGYRLFHSHFNPRTRVGCDRYLNNDYVARQISIHAPAWGATCVSHCTGNKLHDFNPRTRVGCDLVDFLDASRSWNFNPRTRVGCDQKTDEEYYEALISIHAPAWGATTRITKRALRKFISIHAPAWGATAGCDRYHLHGCDFNPRTRVGCDRCLQAAPT